MKLAYSFRKASPSLVDHLRKSLLSKPTFFSPPAHLAKSSAAKTTKKHLKKRKSNGTDILMKENHQTKDSIRKSAKVLSNLQYVSTKENSRSNIKSHYTHKDQDNDKFDFSFENLKTFDQSCKEAKKQRKHQKSQIRINKDHPKENINALQKIANRVSHVLQLYSSKLNETKNQVKELQKEKKQLLQKINKSKIK